MSELLAPANFAPLSRSVVVERALSQKDRGFYKLGGGAAYVAKSGVLTKSPFDGVDAYDDARNQFPGQCDCSGFLAWCAMYLRGRWNTNAIVADAYAFEHGRIVGPGKRERFRGLDKGEQPLPGDFIVKQGVDADDDGDPDGPGHCGIAIEFAADFVRGTAGWWDDCTIAHCTPRHGRPGAIRFTDAAQWRGAGYWIRPLHLID